MTVVLNACTCILCSDQISSRCLWKRVLVHDQRHGGRHLYWFDLLLGASYSQVFQVFWKMPRNDHGDIGLRSVRVQSSVHSLPPELLGKTFSYLSSDGPLQLRHALFVCHFWYNTIIRHPKLWSTIKIDQEFFARFPRELSVRAETLTRLCFERSSPVPLHITLDDFLDPKDSREATMERMALVSRMLGVGNPAHIQRCVSLSWVMMEPDLETASLGEVFPKELKMLESLFIKDFHLHEDDLVSCFPRCPALREVHLVNHIESRVLPYFPDDDFARVEKLVFANKSSWMDYDIPCISRFRTIHTLVLHDLSLAGEKPSYSASIWNSNLDDENSVALLPSLQKLKLVGLILSRFLCRLDLPSLQELHVKEDGPGRHSLTEIPSGILQLVTHIIVISPSSSTSSWSQELREVTNINSAPSLNALTLPSRLHKALGSQTWYIELGCRLHLCVT
jgi:hypothetical protein